MDTQFHHHHHHHHHCLQHFSSHQCHRAHKQQQHDTRGFGIQFPFSLYQQSCSILSLQHQFGHNQQPNAKPFDLQILQDHCGSK
ncbi:hypothetical protein HanPSC8_Chr08g0328141 [Helianthus annuus]|nr:hypothetical protein HanPSC8_Chr08g0328141 [Helianthus annuus]